MDFASIRNRLAGLEGKAYWRSLEELADTQEFNAYVQREFPSQASEFSDPAGRRTFLKLMGASLALAGVGACTRQPPEKLVPYVRQPEELIPGRPLFFATAMPMGGYAYPLLAENHMGRPTKIEGNPEHPASLGGTEIFSQASVLDVYDPDRSRNLLGRGEIRTWSAFLAALQGAMATQRAVNGAGLRILTEPVSSPSLTAQLTELMQSLPEAKWHQWDPVYGTVQGGAPDAHAVYNFKDADVIVSLDADFLGIGAGQVRYSKDFSSRRRIDTPAAEQNRLYVVEPVPTITGGKADHRLAVRAQEIHQFAAALAAAVGAGGSAPGTFANAEAGAFIAAVANDLKAHRGKSVVLAGPYQPAAVHAVARAINDALGNTGATVHYGAPVVTSPLDGAASLTDLVSAMNAGKVDLLVVIDANPVFTAPADLQFADAFQKVGTRVHIGTHFDETAALCHWHLNGTHYLESWGDAKAFDGTVTLTQPLIAPIYDAKQPIEVLAAMNGNLGKTASELVKEFWVESLGSEAAWRKALHDGFISGAAGAAGAASAARAGSAGAASAMAATSSATASSTTTTSSTTAPTHPAPAAPAAPAAPTQPGFEIVFRPDPTVLDGRFANNGWLQETPKPLSRLTWDNAAYISVATAEKLGVKNEDVIEISSGGRSASIPVWIMPGTAEDTIAVHFGYGQNKLGRVASGAGVNVYPIRTSTAPWFIGGADVKKTGATHVLASTQTHFNMDGRNPVRVVTAEEYRQEPKESVAKLGPETPPKSLTLYEDFEDTHGYYKDHKWGMAIDLNACTGCGVCITACVAENNIPVVGKEQIKKSREMHWIRVDTYFEGSLDAPKMVHQPVPCQQCENAPCEQVCPVAATTHSDEGLNDMVYNRCVGTRYCSNNCPYKVRRFNYLLYQDFTTEEIKAQRNPDVTIRSRGVMEKCTYCVQRISHARIDAKTEGRAMKDGDVVTACQQACPTDAIVFGDLNDPNAAVTKLKKQDRNYGILEDLNTRPRTTYLAVVRNPNPALEKA